MTNTDLQQRLDEIVSMLYNAADAVEAICNEGKGAAQQRVDRRKVDEELEADREALRVAQRIEQLEIDEERWVERLRIEEDRQQLAYDQAIADELAADRLADEQVTADEFAAAKSEEPTVRIELDAMAASVAWLDIPDSLSDYAFRIREVLRTASDTIKELIDGEKIRPNQRARGW